VAPLQGEIYMYFSFEWDVAGYTFFVSGELDMTPFSFELPSVPEPVGPGMYIDSAKNKNVDAFTNKAKETGKMVGKRVMNDITKMMDVKVRR
jgi:hypothetical protein